MAVTEASARNGQNFAGNDSCEDCHDEEALARRHLDCTGWWHRCLDHLPSRLRADCRISPLIFSSGSVRSTNATSFRKTGSRMSALAQERTLKHLDPTSALLPQSGPWLSASRCPLYAKSGHQFGFDGEDPRTLYATVGRRIPLSANSPTGSTVTALSTACRTRGAIRI